MTDEIAKSRSRQEVHRRLCRTLLKPDSQRDFRIERTHPDEAFRHSTEGSLLIGPNDERTFGALWRLGEQALLVNLGIARVAIDSEGAWAEDSLGRSSGLDGLTIRSGMKIGAIDLLDIDEGATRVPGPKEDRYVVRCRQWVLARGPFATFEYLEPGLDFDHLIVEGAKEARTLDELVSGTTTHFLEEEAARQELVQVAKDTANRWSLEGSIEARRGVDLCDEFVADVMEAFGAGHPLSAEGIPPTAYDYRRATRPAWDDSRSPPAGALVFLAASEVGITMGDGLVLCARREWGGVRELKLEELGRMAGWAYAPVFPK